MVNGTSKLWICVEEVLGTIPVFVVRISAVESKTSNPNQEQQFSIIGKLQAQINISDSIQKKP